MKERRKSGKPRPEEIRLYQQMERASATGWLTEEAEGGHAASDFDAAVREYWPRVFRFALVSLRDRGEAESLTQDCFLKAFQGWRHFRGDSSVKYVADADCRQSNSRSPAKPAAAVLEAHKTRLSR